jgi:putative transcriptional regulator
MQSSYLDWNFNNPELAVAGTILHGFEFLFVRLSPFVLIAAVIGIVFTYKRE